ncbi:hypothetical protein BDR26DRAFT_370069, partial [Obelidium mucronatum]
MAAPRKHDRTSWASLMHAAQIRCMFASLTFAHGRHTAAPQPLHADAVVGAAAAAHGPHSTWPHRPHARGGGATATATHTKHSRAPHDPQPLRRSGAPSRQPHAAGATTTRPPQRKHAAVAAAASAAAAWNVAQFSHSGSTAARSRNATSKGSPRSANADSARASSRWRYIVVVLESCVCFLFTASFFGWHFLFGFQN